MASAECTPQGRGRRRLAAIPAADVAGYSRLIGNDEEGTPARLRDLFRKVVQPGVSARRGRVFKLMGDAFLGESPSAVEAVLGPLRCRKRSRRVARPIPRAATSAFAWASTWAMSSPRAATCWGWRESGGAAGGLGRAGHCRGLRRGGRGGARACALHASGSWRAEPEEQRPAGARFPAGARCGPAAAGSRGCPACAFSARPSLRRGSTLPEHERRSGAGLLRRRHRRGHHHRTLAYPLSLCHRAQQRLYVQGMRGGCPSNRARPGRALRRRGQRQARGRAAADYRPAYRR